MSIEIIYEDVQIWQVVLAYDIAGCLCIGLDKELYVFFEKFSE